MRIIDMFLAPLNRTFHAYSSVIRAVSISLFLLLLTSANIFAEEQLDNSIKYGDVKIGNKITVSPTEENVERIKNVSGVTIIDGSLRVLEQMYGKSFDFVGVSTPATPSAGHARLFYSSTTYQYCAVFDNASVACSITGGSTPGTLSTVNAGIGLSGGGSGTSITIHLSTPIAQVINTSSGSFNIVNITTFTPTNITANQVTFIDGSGRLVGNSKFLWSASSQAVVLNVRDGGGNDDFVQTGLYVNGSIQLSSGPSAAGPPFGTTFAGIALRSNATEPFSGGYSLLSRSPSYLMECTQSDSSIPWCFAIGQNKNAFFGNPSNKLSYVPQSRLEILGGQTIGTDYGGVATAPVNGLMIEGNAQIGSSVTFTGQVLTLISNGASALEVSELQSTGVGRMDIGYDGVFSGNLFTVAHFNNKAAGSTYGTASANNNVIKSNGTSGALLIGVDGSTSVIVATNATKRIEVLSTGQVVFSSYTSFTTAGHGVIGTPSNGTADIGIVGQYKSSTTLALTNFTTTNQYTDLAVISLEAGDWDVSGCIYVTLNGAVLTTYTVGISQTSGNSGTGLVQGDSRLDQLPPTAASDVGVCIANVRKSLTTTTSIYLKYLGTYTGGPPKAHGRLSARRAY